MATKLEILQALALLEKPEIDVAHPPAVVVMPPDSGDFILGNRDGFVRLAVASPKADRGEAQSFKDKDWVRIEDLDWGISGLKPDPSAHIWRSGLGSLVVLLLVLFILVGSITTVRLALHVS
jgi:hypothetical protein